jgi:hypothetical protein
MALLLLIGTGLLARSGTHSRSTSGFVAGGTVPWGGLAWGIALAAIEVLLACWFFARVHRDAVRTGLIARYSAESVT